MAIDQVGVCVHVRESVCVCVCVCLQHVSTLCMTMWCVSEDHTCVSVGITHLVNACATLTTHFPSLPWVCNYLIMLMLN